MAKVKNTNVGHSTDLNRAFELMVKNNTVVDRIVVFSDCQAYDVSGWGGGNAQKAFEQYRREVNPNAVLHSVDLAGYGSKQFVGKGVNTIAGWSDKVFEFIRLSELGTDGLIKVISNYN
jgi:hypothetical protein